jgi:Fe-S-cluster containining protein
VPVKPAWWSAGIRFECTGSGRCCVSRGEYGFVYLTREDRRRLANHLGLAPAEFRRRFCGKTEGLWHLADLPAASACRFLDGTRCTVYEARPTQCRTWPFWPENMDAKKWDADVAAFCPGVGRGRLWTEAEIRAVVEQQQRADEEP